MAEIRVLFVPWKKLSEAEMADKSMRELALINDEYVFKNEKWLAYEARRSREIKAEHSEDFDEVRKAMRKGPGPHPEIEKVRSAPWFRKMMRQWYEVWYTGAEDPLLRSLGDGHIYIRGHSLPDLGKIGIPVPGRRGLGATLEPKEVAKRLQESGLNPKTFKGKIKCYNCHSAEAGEYSFAQLLADEMWALGYTDCTYFGYEGAIDSIPGQHDSFPWAKGHRTSKCRATRANSRSGPVKRGDRSFRAKLNQGDRSKYINSLSEFDKAQLTKEQLFPKAQILGPSS